MRRPRVRLLLCLVAVAFLAAAPGSAAAFGTIDSGGQQREHERITRAALACAGDGGSEANCFEPRSMDYLAGHDREFGAVGAPDNDELSDPAAHCDGADFLTGGYPRTREQATAALMDCVDQMRSRFGEGVDSAKGLVDAEGEIIAAEVSLDPECNPREAAEDRAKCASLEALGRVLHGAQDFYAHSNWADSADPARPVSADNPPGLDLPAPSAVLDLLGTTPPIVPPDLSTGCYVLKDEVPGVGDCTQRITHAGLNKDRGIVDPATGATSDPTTPRGMVEDDFAKAVAAAVAESRRQWSDLQSALRTRYGEEQGDLAICALTHDDPVEDCRAGDPFRLVGLLLVAGAALAAAVLILRHRRRSAGGP